MNIENKKTTLSDDAALYKHETDNMTEKDKLKNMNAGQKWEHFKQYYLLKLVFAVVGIGIITAVMVSILKPHKKEVFYACVFDLCVDRDKIYSISDEFEKSLMLDTEKYQVTFDQDFIFNGPYSDSVQRYAMLTKSGRVTVTILPESIYAMFAASDYYENMEDVLSVEELEKYKDKLAFASKKDENGNEIEGTSKPYGIVLDDCERLAGNVCTERVILAIPAGKKDDQYGRDFLKFLFAKE